VTEENLRWLLEDPDPALRYQIHRDLLKTSARDLAALRGRIPESPWMRELMSRRNPDGGCNCVYHQGADRSSLHTTIAVLEGLLSYIGNGGAYRRKDAEAGIRSGIEFILRYRLYRSERTGEVIKDEFLKFPFPVRWKYDILRCLDLFTRYRIPFDERMEEALEMVERAANPRGSWRAASQPGKTYLVHEKNGSEGRWNTLRALRVLGYYRV